ncbi:MAG: acyl-CoA thioesterase [Candidatus Binatia bacterium]
MSDTLASYRVIYGDTDQMGVVYYANYLRWFEMGRTEFLRQMAVPYTSIENRGCHFPVTEVSCRYFRPARYDDEITIETVLNSLGRASLTFNYRLYRRVNQSLLAAGWTKHACVDQEGQVRRLPPALETILKPNVTRITETVASKSGL